MSRTEDKGSSGSSDNAEAASGNAEFPPPKPRNIICLLSSLDLKSGNVYHSQQVGPLTFSYNSLDTTDGPLGIGWTHDFNMSITPDPDGSLFLKTGDGNRTWYGPNTSGVYYSDVKSGDSSSITANADGSYTRTTRYGKVYSFDASGKLAGITDRNGNATTLTYTGDDLTGIEYPGGRAVGITVEAGKIKTITDFLGKNWTVAYSTAGQIEYITDPLGNAWHFQYNSNNRMEHKTDPSGNTSTYVYDPATGKLTAAADPNNIQKSMVYNASTNTTTVTESDGGTWVHKYYPPFNVPLEITDPYGKKTIYAYNSGNQLLSITYPDQTSTIYAYDAGGNVATVTDRRGKTTTYSYNAQNRLTGIQDPAGNTAHITCDSSGNIATYQDPAGNVTTYSRDSRGNITGIEDPLLHKTTLAYDAYNQLTSVTDATNVQVSFQRDTAGNILTLTDTLGNTTTFSPDNIGQVVAITDPLGHITDFEYDANGNRKKITDPLGRVTSYTHNFRGQLTGITDATGKSTILSYQPGTCCGGGGEKLTSITDPAGSVSYFSYDQRGELIGTQDPLNKTTSLDYDILTRTATRTDRLGDALTYAYSLTGKLQSITYPDQTTVSYSYNENTDWLTGMQNAQGAVNYYYNDPRGYITDVTDAFGFTLHFEYDGAGNLWHIWYPDSTIVTYGYDAANRLTTVSTSWSSETATYGYIAAGGGITGRLETFTQFNGISTSYAYDAASRLTGITCPVASYQFTLDAVGNRTGSVETVPLSAVPEPGITSYGYNTRKNRLLSSGGIDYSYDDEGQLASAGGTALTFDCDHRLTEISDTNGTDQFFYDARGFRIKAIRGGVETRYIYDPWGNLLAEANASNQITRKYVYGKGLIALVTPSARYCYHFDAIGHTIALTDMAGTVVNSYAYEPFGKILAEQETIAQPFKYVGQYGVMAEPSGLYYMRARYYDPSVGRFISEDPLGFGGGDVNLSAYVRSNPVNWIDPSGLEYFKNYWDYVKLDRQAGTFSYDGQVLARRWADGLWREVGNDNPKVLANSCNIESEINMARTLVGNLDQHEIDLMLSVGSLGASVGGAFTTGAAMWTLWVVGASLDAVSSARSGNWWQMFPDLLGSPPLGTAGRILGPSAAGASFVLTFP